MAAIIDFVFSILSALLGLLSWAIILNAILSWLVVFDVINLRNRFVYSLSHFLEAVTRPIMRPIQRIVPSLGGVDISPIIVLLIIWGVRDKLLPPLASFLISTLG